VPLHGSPPCGAEKSQAGAPGAQSAGPQAAMISLPLGAGVGKRTRSRGPARWRWGGSLTAPASVGRRKAGGGEGIRATSEAGAERSGQTKGARQASERCSPTPSAPGAAGGAGRGPLRGGPYLRFRCPAAPSSEAAMVPAAGRGRPLGAAAPRPSVS